MTDEKKEMALREKRKDVTKEVVRGGVKFCVGAFFGALAGFITKDQNMPKFNRYSTIAGAMLVGSFVGDQAANGLCLSIDNFSEHWNQFQTARQEEEGKNGRARQN